jgi:hypothetical protein
MSARDQTFFVTAQRVSLLRFGDIASPDRRHNERAQLTDPGTKAMIPLLVVAIFAG